MELLPQTTDRPGAVLHLTTNVPVLGVRGLADFVSEEALTSAASFSRWFRLRIAPGLAWSDWRELTAAALQALPFGAPVACWLEFRYTQVGEGTATLVRLTLTGRYEAPAPEAVPPDSPLAGLDAGARESAEQTDLEAALLRRLFEPGILPAFIERPEVDEDGALVDPLAAEGFLAVFGATTAVLARVLRYARQLPRVDQHIERLRPWLAGQGLLFSPEAVGLYEARALMRTRAQRLLVRGTPAVAAVGTDTTPPGEVRLLLDAQTGDEFFFTPVPAAARGWCLGASSPGYHSTQAQPGLHRRYGPASGPTNVRQWPIRAAVSSAAAQESQAAVTQFTLVAGHHPAGVTSWLRSAVIPSPGSPIRLGRARDSGPGGLPLTHEADYELSFWIRQYAPGASFLQIGVEVVDDGGRTLVPTRLDDGAPSATIVDGLQLAHTDWHFVRLLLFHHEHPLSDRAEQLRTSLGVGRNLRLPTGAAAVYPVIEYSVEMLDLNAPLPGADVADIRLRPLTNGLTVASVPSAGRPASGRHRGNGSRGLSFLGAAGLLQFWYRNRGSLDEAAVLDAVGRYLVPAGTHLLAEPLGRPTLPDPRAMRDFDEHGFTFDDFT